MRWLLVLLAACGGSAFDDLPVSTNRVERIQWLVDVPKKLDVLFVVDNSPAMAAHEATWLANQRTMMEVLQTIPGGLPSVHIGVVTTDVGTTGRDGHAGLDAAGCHADGDRGELGRETTHVLGTFLSDIELANGMRQKNYVGSLEDAFAELATVGTAGCTYVQPFAAMLRGLSPVSPANAGFVRPDARLLVVFVTPNDDCSFEHGGFAVESGAVNARECFTRDTELVDVDQVAALLRSTKTDPTRIIVSLLAGPTEPVQVSDGPEGLQVAPSCTFEDASALPSLRLNELIDRFPNRATFRSICQQNWSDALSVFAGFPTSGIGNPCIESTLLDVDPEREGLQAECAVAYRAAGEERSIPACEAVLRAPCWRIVEDPQKCSVAPYLSLDVLHAGEIDEGTHVVADCLVQ